MYTGSSEKPEGPLPFNPMHKFLTTFSYKPLSKRFHFDMNVHWYGEQHLPGIRANQTKFQRPGFSKPNTITSAQFTYNLTRFVVLCRMRKSI